MQKSKQYRVGPHLLTSVTVRNVPRVLWESAKEKAHQKDMTLRELVIATLERHCSTESPYASEIELRVFGEPLGRQPICYTYIWDSLDLASRKAGLPHVSSHAMRHAFRSWLDSLGTTVGTTQRLMRHASVTTTMDHYGTALKADMRAAHEKVIRLAQVSAGFKQA